MHKMLMFILMYYLLDDKNYNIRFTSARQSYDVLSATQSELYPLTWHKRLSCNRKVTSVGSPKTSRKRSKQDPSMCQLISTKTAWWLLHGWMVLVGILAVLILVNAMGGLTIHR
jgi:hypothetical protein